MISNNNHETHHEDQQQIDTLSDLDEFDQLDEQQLYEQFLSLLEVYENCLNNIKKLLDVIGKPNEDSLLIRKDIKHEKEFALSLSKDLHELLYAHNSHISEYHNLDVLRYKKRMQELNALFQRLKELETKYPESNLPETSKSGYLAPVYKKLSNYIFRKDEFEQELLNQHGMNDEENMTSDKLDELKNDLTEIVSVFETLEDSTKKSTFATSPSVNNSNSISNANNNPSTTNTNTESVTNNNINSNTLLHESSSAPSEKQQFYYGTAAMISLGLLAGGIIGGPLGAYVGAKLGAGAVTTTAAVGSGIGMLGGSLLFMGKGYLFKQGKAESMNETTSSSTAKDDKNEDEEKDQESKKDK
ncbi:hypothetical protein C9374_009733 [Naegleria lovaniensis]|uniref:Uncharacterized protein n=1 Tax=Naegleria lovaniensis TaxID=51637 RepID=A0AA88KRA8_NAELO|nr:uncharacterized protein C9374_009733 [Naegleria lovaniensis]KAG2393156.1 hypothetical protein C9374_009733 [Naegleria lovaniensis]